MKHIELDKSLQRRVMNYYELIWHKFRGLDDAKILSYLPINLRDDTALEILQKLFNTEVFLKGEIGVNISIIKRLKIITVPQGEYIVKKGEIGNEMYFILEGRVDVEIVSDDEIIKLITIKQGKYFGEMAIL